MRRPATKLGERSDSRAQRPPLSLLLSRPQQAGTRWSTLEAVCLPPPGSAGLPARRPQAAAPNPARHSSSRTARSVSVLNPPHSHQPVPACCPWVSRLSATYLPCVIWIYPTQGCLSGSLRMQDQPCPVHHPRSPSFGGTGIHPGRRLVQLALQASKGYPFSIDLSFMPFQTLKKSPPPPHTHT